MTVSKIMDRKELKNLREKYSIPIETMAKKVKLSPSFIHALESGKVESREYNYEKYADALHKETDKFSIEKTDIFVNYLLDYCTKELKCSKGDFCSMCGISTSFFYNYEKTKKISYVTVKRIESAIGQSYDEIVGIIEPETCVEKSTDIDILKQVFPNHVTSKEDQEHPFNEVEDDGKRKIWVSYGGGDRKACMMVTADQLDAIKAFLNLLKDNYFSDIVDKVKIDDGVRTTGLSKRGNKYYKTILDVFTGEEADVEISREEFLKEV